MADGVEVRVGDRRYWVYGLDDLDDAISEQRRRMSEIVGERSDAAEAALAEWRGPHAESFVDRANALLSDMLAFEHELRDAALQCRYFPDEPTAGYAYPDMYEYRAVRVSLPGDGPDVSADPDALDGYAGGSPEQDGRYAGMADVVSTEDLRAEVAVQRSLTAEEREARAEDWPEGLEHELDRIQVWAEPEECPVEEVFGLPDLSGQAATLQATSEELATWVAAVAGAFEDNDQGRLDLLLEHPQLAGFLDGRPGTDGTMTGEGALAVLLEELDMLDTAAGRGEPDGVVGLPDLEAVIGDDSVPAHVRAAARYLRDNRLLLSQVAITADREVYELEPEASEVSREDIELFLELNGALRALALDFERVDTANEGDDPDGHVSVDDLQALAESPDAPDDLREAAQLLLDNPILTQRLSQYQYANGRRLANVGGGGREPEVVTEHVGYGEAPRVATVAFDREGLIALAIDQQAFGSDPAAARRFVQTLPVPDVEGNGGLPVELTSDEGVQALANAALRDTTSLTGQHEVIAHLPETTGWHSPQGAVEQDGGVRNRLITGFYALLADRMDGITAGDLAGRPEVSGHPGANWATFGQWASFGVHEAITGDATMPLGPVEIGSLSASQAAADGNQWIFNDVGGRFAAFVEMYGRNPHPTEADMEAFFRRNFDEGDGTAQTAFAAYVAAVEEPDPLRRQQLMYQANTLIGLHEQAGVQPYIDALTPTDWDVVDEMATDRTMRMQVGDDVLELSDDVPARPRVNNLIEPGTLAMLDPAGRGPGSYSGGPTTFDTDGERVEGAVDVEDLAGIESFRPDVNRSLTDIVEAGGTLEPGGLAGTGASEWSDWDERMNFIVNYFHQYHTDPELHDRTQAPITYDAIEWLEDGARPGGRP